MGKDKGLLISQGKPWAEIVKEKFSQVSIPAFLSINSAQKKNYLLYFNEKDLVIDRADFSVQGPLLGLLSAHYTFPEHDFLVLACDMINMEAEVLKKLLDDYNPPIINALAYKDERVEPMCAIYSARGLKKIAAHYRQNEFQSQSMLSVLEKLNAKYISIPLEWKPFFKNLNIAADLN